MVMALTALLVVCVALIVVLARRIIDDDRPRRVRAEERPHDGWTEIERG